VRLSLFYGALFLLVGLYAPYFPVWLEWRGLTPGEIGTVMAAPLMVRIFFTPTVSMFADQIGNRRQVLVGLAWGTLAGWLLYTQAAGFWAILAVAVVVSSFWTSIMPVTEAVAMEGVKRAGHDYGRMRLWGSLSFIAASFGGGLVLQAWGAGSTLWLMIGAATCTILTAHLLPRPSGKGRLRAATQPRRIRAADALVLLRTPIFLLFLAATGLVQAAHAVYYAFGTIHWQSEGIPASVIGALWAVGVAAEIVLFMFSGRVIRTVGVTNLIGLAALAAAVRWTVTAFSPPLWLLFPVQVLHGLTFGAAHLGAVHFITEAVPEEATGTAQGLYASAGTGIFMGGAILSSGPLYSSLGGPAYLVMAGMGALSLLLAMTLRWQWNGQKLIEVGWSGDFHLARISGKKQERNA
jgi:PPP family 3-phenylpropionic acid transporter